MMILQLHGLNRFNGFKRCKGQGFKGSRALVQGFRWFKGFGFNQFSKSVASASATELRS
jgi:hypothetical protein